MKYKEKLLYTIQSVVRTK